MLTKLTITAFKSFKDSSDFTLKPLTVLTGVNSSGKSSVIQAIQVIKALCEGKKLADAFPAGHGGLKELVNKASTPDDLKLKLEVDGGEVFSYENEQTIPLTDKLDCLFISAHRFGPQSSIPTQDNDTLGERGENVLKFLRILEDEIIPEAARHKDAEKYNLLPNLVAWLNEISPGVDFVFDLQEKADTSYALFNDHRATNVGFGLSYSLPVILGLLWATLSPGRIIMIENPEAHLHPRGQSQLAELMCKVARAGSQVIIETHSDHIVNGIRVRTKKFEETAGNGGVDRNDVSIIHVVQDKETEQSKPVEVKIEGKGRIFHAPPDFFEQFNLDRRALLDI